MVVGGLGHIAVQILKALTLARILAVDVPAEKLRLARDVGADETIELMEVLELVDVAYARLREESLNGRAVVCPHG